LFEGDGVDRDFLFCRELSRPFAPLSYYVVSQRLPQAVLGVLSVQSKSYAPQIAPGSRLRFDLHANPVLSRRNQEGKAQRHDVLMDAKRKCGDSDDVAWYWFATRSSLPCCHH